MMIYCTRKNEGFLGLRFAVSFNGRWLINVGEEEEK